MAWELYCNDGWVRPMEIGDPGDSGRDGDCFRLSVAAFLSLPWNATPGVVQLVGEDPVFWGTWRAWSRSRGMELAFLMEPPPPSRFAIASGWSPRYPNDDLNCHAVVLDLEDGSVAYDSHPSGDGILGEPHYFVGFRRLRR